MNIKTQIGETTGQREPIKGIQIWDIVCRIVAASFFIYLVMANILDLVALPQRRLEMGSLYFSVSFCAKLSIITFIGLHCVLFILRWRPIEKARGLLPRLMAVAGSFFFYLIALPQGQTSLLQVSLGSLLVFSGTCLAILALSKLGRSYSMMPEARRLVVTGAYSVVRHPMYLSEEVAIAGIVIQSFSLYAFALFTIHLWIQIQRMKNEETILQKTFPEYECYKGRTARLIPNVY